MKYNPLNWYWLVVGNTTQAYSSASSSYVPLTDATYTAWLAAGGVPTTISAQDMALRQIQALESSITPRMVQEAVTGATTTGLGSGGTMTSAQFIAYVRSEIASIRSAAGI